MLTLYLDLNELEIKLTLQSLAEIFRNLIVRY